MTDCSVILGWLPDGRTPIRCMLDAGHAGQHVAHVRQDQDALERSHP